MTAAKLELKACTPDPVRKDAFNPQVALPHGLTRDHLAAAMSDYTKFLGLVNKQIRSAGMERMESFMMPANFSSMVGEFLITRIGKHCPGLVKNAYHNGHPDLLPVGEYKDDSILRGDHGIEVKTSRAESGWQGHNAEETWLMVFVIDVNSPNDHDPIRPFRFRRALGAQLEQSDWTVSGRGEGSRRTPTAGVNSSGLEKMQANWIYWVD